MKKCILSILLYTLLNQCSIAQYYNGLQHSNWTSIHSLYVNPSSLANARFGLEFNAGSISGSYIPKAFTESDKDLKKANSENYDANYLEARLPSIIYKAHSGIAIALTSRIRGGFDFFGNSNVYNSFIQKTPNYVSSKLDPNAPDFKFEGTALSDVGITVAAPVLQLEEHKLQIGFSYRIQTILRRQDYYFQKMSGNNYLLTANQNLLNRDLLTYNFKAGSTFDFGVSYQFKPNGDIYEGGIADNNYQVKIGLSIVDIGSYKYDNIDYIPLDYNTSSGKVSPFVLENGLTSSNILVEKKVKLPTRSMLMVDVKVGENGFYVGGLWANNFSSELSGLRQPSLVSVAPRFEKKNIEVSLPLTYYTDYQSMGVGVNLRVGPIMVGSDNCAFLFKKDEKMGNIFVGLSVPIGLGNGHH